MQQNNLNIIIINDFQDVNGGASKIAVLEAICLARRGYNVLFFCAVHGQNDEMIEAGVKVVCLCQHDILNDKNRLRAIIQGVWNRKAAKEFSLLLDSFDRNKTIIHIHSWTKALSSSIVSKAIGKKFPIVCTIHDYFTVCPNGGLYNYNKCKSCFLVPMSLRCIFENCDSRSYGKKIWRVLRQSVQTHFGKIPSEVKNFITVSDFSERLLRPLYPHNANFYRVHNAINIPHNVAANPETAGRFIFVGRLSPEKGGHIFAQAARQAGVNACFAGQGDCEEEWRTENPAAGFIGWRSRDELIIELRKSQALVFPSVCYETQGLVVLEAAAIGIPSIVSDGCAARDLIEDGVTGLLFKAGDVADLAEKLHILDNNPDLLKKLGNAAYDKYWRDPFTADRHIDALIKCYRKILEENEK